MYVVCVGCAVTSMLSRTGAGAFTVISNVAIFSTPLSSYVTVIVFVPAVLISGADSVYSPLVSTLSAPPLV